MKDKQPPQSYINHSMVSPSLSNYLTWSVHNYLNRFSRLPKTIRLPIWRQHELEKELDMFLGNTICGVSIIYVVGFNHIELE